MISKGVAIQALTGFFTELWWDNLLAFTNQYPDTTTIQIDYKALVNYHNDLYELMETDPTTILEAAQIAIENVDIPCEKQLQNVCVEITGYPFKTAIRNIRHKHILKYISVEGIVRGVSSVKPKFTNISFECMRCGHVTIIPQPQKKIVEPIECENETCGRKGPFKIDQIKSTFADYQVLEIQESPDSLRGTQPRNLMVNVYNDLTDKVTAGDKVIVSGILATVWQTSKEGKSTVLGNVLEANHIEKLDKSYDELDISEADMKAIRELSKQPDVKLKLIGSIAPSIYGLDLEKEALVLQLFSGVAKQLPDGSRIRGDTHILLIGDPGTAKSQLIKRVVNLSPRGVFNSGKSASGVGLTAAVVKDNLSDDRWKLEAGSLVMADNGLCAVDEMDKMSAEDVSSLHEALEQQVVTISKAGIHAQLNTRCALIGAANPVNARFDPYDSDIAGQINMKHSLLSRFDLIFIIRDVPNKENDANVASQISKNHVIGGHISNGKLCDAHEITTQIDTELFRKYVAFARANIKPIISLEAKRLIEDFYVDVRSTATTSKTIPLTARNIDGLYRLAEANAKTRLSEEVTAKDAKEAIRLTVECLKQVILNHDTNTFDIDMIECGGSKSQKEKMKIFEDFTKKNKNFTFAELSQHFEYDTEHTEQFIQILKNHGEIIEIEHRVYKTT